jgi:hypothetical protein
MSKAGLNAILAEMRVWLSTSDKNDYIKSYSHA